MAKTRAGTPVQKVQIRNPLAVSIVNARVTRDKLDAATAGALIIIESQSNAGGGKKQESFRDKITEK